MSELPRNTILEGDALEQLRMFPAASVDCVITSPPYYLLRNYGVAGQLGLEPSVHEWVANLRRVFAEVARVIKASGSVWLNLGDSYSRHDRYGAPAKSLLLGPERLLLALVADGWRVRNKVVWAKPNPMPTSIRDRLSTTHEVIVFLTRSRRYFFDLDAIREDHRSTGGKTAGVGPHRPPAWVGPLAGKNDGLTRARAAGVPGHVLGKNPGDVWSIATRGYRGAHFATFPEELVRRPLLATCPEAICDKCGTAWRRQITVRRFRVASGRSPTGGWRTEREVGEFLRCDCRAPTSPGVVLDPFFGTGTVGVVARQFGRDYVGIELNPEFVALAESRLAALATGVRRGPAPTGPPDQQSGAA